jgi:Arc/MetJ family transcription regulator
MRTTLDLDEDLVQRAMAATGSRTKTEAIERGLQALLDIEARKVAIAQGGTMPHLELPPRRSFSSDLEVTRHPARRKP